ncbi:phage tail tube protein [Actinacidiphila acididurans]|uniref:Tail protein n=1 Tax=Actinacidiphila acididurans TaxID=2784346 RepID=A0ABS2TN69_9ACTN|nr:phage tail tube protein [Actinacidiphila acididurans]MBM9504522.1 hypothetical protein [Actinacidiphila acididurans]
MPAASAFSYLGIAKEATFGTPVASTAFIPVTGVTPKDNLTLLEDKGMRGSMTDVYDEIAGPISAELDWDGDAIPDTIGWALAGVLGEVATTGASAPYSHAMTVLNSGTGQPSSYTINDFYSAGNRQYPGAKLSELGFKFSADGLLTYSAKAVTLGSATAAAPPPSWTAIPPLAAWIGAVQIGGVASTLVMDGEVTIKRTVTVINTVDGTQAPLTLWSGPVSVDGKFTLIMESDAQLTNYLTTVKPALDFDFSQGAGSAAVELKLHMSKVAYSAADITRGKDYIELPVTFKALANTTDVGTSAGYGPIKATLKNAVASGVYV